MAKKNMTVVYKNVYVVVSTKGGEGKTFLSFTNFTYFIF